MRETAAAIGGRPASVGVDTWGVDFGLLAKDGTLLGLPFCYRDHRNAGAMEEYFKLVPREALYEATGIQFMPFNTLFQIYAMVRDRSPLLDAASDLLFMPDLFNFLLTGKKAAEFTIASTSQISIRGPRPGSPASSRRWACRSRSFRTSSTRGRSWARSRRRWPAPRDSAMSRSSPRPATTRRPRSPPCRPRERTGPTSRRGPGPSSGSRRGSPIITPRRSPRTSPTRAASAGPSASSRTSPACGSSRAAGRPGPPRAPRPTTSWPGPRPEAPPFAALVDPDDPAFLNPPDMPEAVAAYCRRTGQEPPASRAAIVRSLLESLALKYRLVIDELGRIVETAHPPRSTSSAAAPATISSASSPPTRRVSRSSPARPRRRPSATSSSRPWPWDAYPLRRRSGRSSAIPSSSGPTSRPGPAAWDRAYAPLPRDPGRLTAHGRERITMAFLRGGVRMDPTAVEKAYASAREKYAERGVDAEKALARLQAISLSLHCWQGDDVGGFERRAERPGRQRPPGHRGRPGKGPRRSTSSGPTWPRRSPSSRAATASISTPCTANSAARPSTATRSSPSISAAGRNGPATRA